MDEAAAAPAEPIGCVAASVWEAHDADDDAADSGAACGSESAFAGAAGAVPPSSRAARPACGSASVAAAVGQPDGPLAAFAFRRRLAALPQQLDAGLAAVVAVAVQLAEPLAPPAPAGTAGAAARRGGLAPLAGAPAAIAAADSPRVPELLPFLQVRAATHAG